MYLCYNGDFIFLSISHMHHKHSLARHKMVWSTNHDVLLCREILITEPYRYKAGTRERGQAWDKVAQALNSIEGVRFVVDQRAVRERYAKLERNYKRKMAAEERASGVNPELTELDEAVASIIERKEGAEEELARREENNANLMDKERETAESVRKRSMERLAETRERENQMSAKKKRRGNGEESIEFLKNKSKIEMEMRREEVEIRKKEHEATEKKAEQEIELRRRELNVREREQQAREKRDEKILEILIQQQQQQQAMLLQMQQVNQALLSLINNMKEKQN